MTTMMSACGVWCSSCPAYLARTRGAAYRQTVAAAWLRIYQLEDDPGKIACGGCLGPDDQLFHSSRGCTARRCCRSRGLVSCAECAVDSCADLEHAQATWDGVPAIARRLSRADAVRYALPYCGHRRRLAAARGRFTRPPGPTHAKTTRKR